MVTLDESAEERLLKVIRDALKRQEYNLRYSQGHVEKLKVKQHEYRQEHKDEKAEYNLRYGQEHKVEKAEHDRQYRKEHADEVEKYRREHKGERAQYDLKHKDEIAERARRRYQEHKGEIAEKSRRHRQEHRSEFRERRRRYYQEHKKGWLEYGRRYRLEHPEVRKASWHKRRAELAGSDGHFTSEEFKLLCEAFGNVCFYCKQALPLTPDHVVPLSRGGSNRIDNIIPACRSCNAKKHTKTFDEYVTELGGLRGVSE